MHMRNEGEPNVFFLLYTRNEGELTVFDLYYTCEMKENLTYLFCVIQEK